MNAHLDQNFLPRHLVYNYGDNYADNIKQLEEVLKDMEGMQDS